MDKIFWIALALLFMGLVFWIPTLNTWFVDFSTAPAQFTNMAQIACIIAVFGCIVNVITD